MSIGKFTLFLADMNHPSFAKNRDGASAAVQPSNIFEKWCFILEPQNAAFKMERCRPGNHVPQDFLHAYTLLERDQRKADPVLLCASGSADSVEIVFILIRQIIIDHSLHIIHVYPPGCHICGYENGEFPFLEAFHGLRALRLPDIAVNTFRSVPFFFQAACKPVHHEFRIAENHDSVIDIRVEQVKKIIGFPGMLR